MLLQWLELEWDYLLALRGRLSNWWCDMKEKELIRKIEQWAEDRNLILGSTPQKQFIKLMEEFGELCAGIARNDKEKIKDSIGDCGVVLIILNEQCQIEKDLTLTWEFQIETPENQIKYTMRYLNDLSWLIDDGKDKFVLCELITELNGYAHYYGFTMLECLEHAYEQIKDRKGKMREGVWIKEGDLNGKSKNN